MLERAGAVATIKSPEAEGVRRLLDRLGTMWGELQEQAERRQQTLDATYQLEQYYFDVAEVESWLGEQELLLLSEEKGKVLPGGGGGGGDGVVRRCGVVGSSGGHLPTTTTTTTGCGISPTSTSSPQG